MRMKQEFTISIFSENHVGILTRITNVFTRRNLNIESLTTSMSALPDVHKFTIVVYSTRDEIEKVSKQIEKGIDVIKAFVLTEDEIIHQEVALYKVPTKTLLEGNEIEKLVREYGARILEVTKEYTVIEKTGHQNETQELFDKMDKYGVVQFTRSGRISVTKSKDELLDNYLRNLESKKNGLTAN